MSIIGERIRQRREELGMSQAELAEKTQRSQQAIDQLERGLTHRPRGILEMAEVLGVSPVWLQGKSDSVGPPAIHRPATASVPEVDLRGGGVADTDEYDNMVLTDDIKARWELPSDYLRFELRASPKAVRIIEVKGDSMDPTLQSGDRVMIDTDDRRPSPAGVFALWDGLGVVVKRLEYVPNSDPPLLKIKSDNSRHDEYQRALDEVSVIGRVVWFGRRL